MSFLDVYIGDLEDPDFHWEGGNWNGNIPRRLSKVFPLSSYLFTDVIRKIKTGEIEGKQTDWGSFTAKLDKEELRKFVEDSYRVHLERWTLEHIVKDIEELKEYIDGLEENKKYALVACET